MNKVSVTLGVAGKDVVHGPPVAPKARLRAVLGRAACVTFLEQYEGQIAAYLRELEQYFKPIAGKMTLSGRLAFENGLGGFRAQKRWASRALHKMKEATK